MADDDAVSQFCAICNTEPNVARFYLHIGGNSLERGASCASVISREIAWIFFITNIPLAHTVPAMDEYFTNPNWRIQHEDAPGGEVSGRSEYCFQFLSIATCS